MVWKSIILTFCLIIIKVSAQTFSAATWKKSEMNIYDNLS